MSINFLQGQIIAFDKPYRATSFQLVAQVRRLLSRRIGRRLKVGHAGTLDPLATGVLVICTGRATKQVEALQSHTKEYVAELRLGATTPSFDREHEEDATYPTSHINEPMVREAFRRFEGTIDQVPPLFSACKIDGDRAYKLARKGRDVELRAKPVRIDSITLEELRLPDYARIRVVCGKGTYIRALARDIGQALGSGAYLLSLRRTRVGDIRVTDCWTVEDFEKWLSAVETDNEPPEGPVPKDFPLIAKEVSSFSVEKPASEVK